MAKVNACHIPFFEFQFKILDVKDRKHSKVHC